jgi:hypothetical protein
MAKSWKSRSIEDLRSVCIKTCIQPFRWCVRPFRRSLCFLCEREGSRSFQLAPLRRNLPYISYWPSRGSHKSLCPVVFLPVARKPITVSKDGIIPGVQLCWLACSVHRHSNRTASTRYCPFVDRSMLCF